MDNLTLLEIFNIFKYLPFDSINNFISTCKKYNKLKYKDFFWNQLYINLENKGFCYRYCKSENINLDDIEYKKKVVTSDHNNVIKNIKCVEFRLANGNLSGDNYVFSNIEYLILKYFTLNDDSTLYINNCKTVSIEYSYLYGKLIINGNTNVFIIQCSSNLNNGLYYNYRNYRYDTKTNNKSEISINSARISSSCYKEVAKRKYNLYLIFCFIKTLIR